jgi:hypothetical protein
MMTLWEVAARAWQKISAALRVDRMGTSILRLLALVGATLLAAGSATIIKGTGQPVTITTNPPGAQVFVDNQPVGVSPITLNLKHDDHAVSATLAGYAPGYARLTTGFSGWSLFFFPVGTIIDAVTGAITTLDQDSVIIQLAPGGAPGTPLQPGGPAMPPPGGSAERH